MFLEQLLGAGDEPGGIGSAGELGMPWRGWEEWAITWDQTVGGPSGKQRVVDTGDAVGGEEKA